MCSLTRAKRWGVFGCPRALGKSVAQPHSYMAIDVASATIDSVRYTVSWCSRARPVSLPACVCVSFQSGLLGVVAKPTSGAIGFASQTVTGIANTPDALFDRRLVGDTLTH